MRQRPLRIHVRQMLDQIIVFRRHKSVVFKMVAAVRQENLAQYAEVIRRGQAFWIARIVLPCKNNEGRRTQYGVPSQTVSLLT